jgi:alpha-L-fucosidase 2
MKILIFLLAVVVSLACADNFSPPNSNANPLRLWYSTSGSLWNDSMPIGNGRLGGMIRGLVSTELISINEDSLWSGNLLNRINPSAEDSLSRIKPWLLRGDPSDAELESNLGVSGVPSSMREYMPGGDFQIYFQNQSLPKGFERWLDLGDGTAGVYYTAGSVAYKREYFASNPSDVLAVRLTASSPGALSFYIKFQRPSNQQNRFVESAFAENGETIITKFISGQIQAVFGARIHIIGGSKRQVGDQIQVFGADEAWIYADIETSVRHANPQSQVESKLAAAVASTYPAVRQKHVNDYQKLHNRTSLNLGSSSDQQKLLPTDARRQALGNGGFDPELVALYFQYGRYLLISSSRDGYYPANLQGVWNNDLNPAWGSKYTININLQMNYWPAEVTSK